MPEACNVALYLLHIEKGRIPKKKETGEKEIEGGCDLDSKSD